MSSIPKVFDPELKLIEFCKIEIAFPKYLIFSIGVVFLSISLIYFEHSPYRTIRWKKKYTYPVFNLCNSCMMI